VDGLDPAVARILSVAVLGDGIELVLDGEEPALLGALDAQLRSLAPGVIVTWNGSAFDLPFLADRASRAGVELGLRVRHDPRVVLSRPPLNGHPGAYRATWGAHRHLDAYRVYRSDLGRVFAVSCGLKSLARFVGLEVIEVDRARIHEIDGAALAAYVLSDARLTRELAARRWPTARNAIDDARWVHDGAEPFQASAT
jgi:uncharacterized protein YprB with RNaseH-like and TPR domain